MYRVRPRVYRHREHTESRLSYSDSFGFYTRLRLEPAEESFGHLVHFADVVLQPEAFFSIKPPETVHIVTSLLTGELEHVAVKGAADHIAAGGVALASLSRPDEYVRHNPSRQNKARLLEVWFGKTAAIEQRTDRAAALSSRTFELKQRRGALLPVASGQEHAGALQLPLEAAVYLSLLRPRENLIFETLTSRRTYLYLIEGSLRVEEYILHAGDSVRITRESSIPLRAREKNGSYAD